MKKYLKFIIPALALAILVPAVVFGSPVTVNRLNNDHIEPLTPTDFIQASYLKTTSTTATSTISTGGFAVGTNAFVVQQSSGKVGIGTTTPSNLLSVVGAQPTFQMYDAVEDTNFRITGQAGIFTIGVGTPATPNSILFETDGESYLSQSAPGLGINAGYVNWFTNNTERMRLSASGNLGLGTTSPYAMLSVGGKGVFDKDVRANYYTATSTSVASQFVYASTTALSVSGLGSGGGIPYVGTGGLLKTTGRLTWNDSTDLLTLTGTGITTSGLVTTDNLNITGSVDQAIPYFDGAGNMIVSDWPDLAFDSGSQTLNTQNISTVGSVTVGNGLSVTSGTADFGHDVNVAKSLTVGINLSVAGKTGLGTTTPYAKLSVWGTGTGTDQLANFVNSASSTLMAILENGKVGIGSTSPYATLSITGSASTIPFTISTTTALAASTTLFQIDKAGDIHLGGGVPVLSSCGTAPTLDANATDQSGTITAGAATASCTLTFSVAKKSIPHCVVTSQTGTIAISYTETATALVITNATLGGDKIDYLCALGH